MVMRLVMVFILIAALAGCLKKAADENVSMEPGVTGEAETTEAMDASQDETTQERSVSVEPGDSQTEPFEKPSVQDIQQALKNAGLYEGRIDGISGPATRSAIEAFQSKNGLKVDGKVGPKTWQKLKTYMDENIN